MTRNLFKHLHAETPKPEFTFQDLKKPYTSGEGCYVAASASLFGVSLGGGGGPVLVHRHDAPGRLAVDHRVVNVHKGKVLDFQFSPFIDNILATASEDASVCVTEVNENPSEMKENILVPDVKLSGHTKKVHLLRWHPTAVNVVATSSWDKTIKLWNVATAECVQTYDSLKANTLSIAFNADGSLLAATTKDKLMKIFDPRVPEKCVAEFECCGGSKSSKVFWAESVGYLGVTCFNKMAKRKLRIWDLKKLDEKPIMEDVIDQMTSILMPHFDSDINVLFTAGKGDCNVSYHQLVAEKGYKTISAYRNTDPQKGGCWVPKRALDTTKCEVARFLKLTKNSVVPLSFCVPRKTGADVFQEDIYPDCFAGVPSMTTDEYFEGNNAAPVQMSMDPEKRQDREKVVFEKKKTYAELAAENELLKSKIEELEAKLNVDEAKDAEE